MSDSIKGLVPIEDHINPEIEEHPYVELNMAVINAEEVPEGDDKCFGGFVGQVGNVFVSGSQEYVECSSKRLPWTSRGVHGEWTGEETLDEVAWLDKPLNVEDARYGRLGYRPAFKSAEDAKFFFDQTRISSVDIEPEDELEMIEYMPDVTMKVPKGDPVLSTRIFDSYEDARKDARILAQIEHMKERGKESKQELEVLSSSRPTPSIDTKDRSIPLEKGEDGKFSPMATAIRNNISIDTSIALGVMAQTADPEDMMVKGAQEVGRRYNLRERTDRTEDSVPPHRIMDSLIEFDSAKLSKTELVTAKATMSFMEKGHEKGLSPSKMLGAYVSAERLVKSTGEVHSVADLISSANAHIAKEAEKQSKRETAER